MSNFGVFSNFFGVGELMDWTQINPPLPPGGYGLVVYLLYIIIHGKHVYMPCTFHQSKSVSRAEG